MRYKFSISILLKLVLLVGLIKISSQFISRSWLSWGERKLGLFYVISQV